MQEASLGLPHAGDWLHVLPSRALRLHLRPQEFVMVVKLLLGMNIYKKAGPCPVCGLRSAGGPWAGRGAGGG